MIVGCRICGSRLLDDVIDLGDQYISSRFPTKGDYSTPQSPLVLCLCRQCGLLQLRQTTPPSELYEHGYGYQSGISNTMRSHLRSYHDELMGKVELREGDVVLDIGSNDATFLKFYPQGVVRVGIDPTGSQFSSFYTDEVLIPDYFSERIFRKRFPTERCRIVSSIAMFYDLQDPVRFASDIEKILDDEGVWACEQSYLLSMLETNSIDTICHEHIEYYALSQIKEIADRARLKIIDVQFNGSNGGSFRVYMAKRSSNHVECSALIHSIIQKEQDHGIRQPRTFHDFYQRCKTEARRLRMLIDAINHSGKRVWVYGASTKGNCTLQFAGITKEDIPYAVERNPQKFGRMTPTGIEIISEDEMRDSPPDYLLVLPWHFRKEIIEREGVFLGDGGALIFPFPHLDVFSTRPKLLLTGCGGHIASYFLDHYHKKYHIFGIGYTKKENRHGITRFFIHDDASLMDCVMTLKPEYIVHLAGVSHTQKAIENPIMTLDVNGRMIAVICDCVYRNKLPTRIFNASSSEIFKGHKNYTVRGPDDTHYLHLHPYSIAKIMGHSFVDFYRQEYGCPFYNGIIFTTESCRKSTDFLLNRLAQHSHQWVLDKEPIRIGSLGSMRNIIHASDVAHAIHHILMGGYENYVICHDKSHSVEKMVFDIYKKVGVELTTYEGDYINRYTGEVVLMIDHDSDRDEPLNNIQGDNSGLKKIGWAPQMSVEDILDEITTHHRL